jgi:hypothetical protein
LICFSFFFLGKGGEKVNKEGEMVMIKCLMMSVVIDEDKKEPSSFPSNQGKRVMEKKRYFIFLLYFFGLLV